MECGCMVATLFYPSIAYMVCQKSRKTSLFNNRQITSLEITIYKHSGFHSGRFSADRIFDLILYKKLDESATRYAGRSSSLVLVFDTH